jgi:hypothetical protein
VQSLKSSCSTRKCSWEVRTIKTEYWVAGFVLLAALMLLVVHLSSNDQEFSRYNEGWNGTSAFFSSLDRHRVSMVSEPGQLNQYRSGATLLIIAPWRNPSSNELAAYRSFLDNGNTIILADDFGTGNTILAGLTSRISINPGPVASLDREYTDPYSVVVYRSANESPVENTNTLLLNEPASLDGGTPLLRTSVFSWIDENRDRHISNEEVLGIYTVMAKEKNGQGTLIVFSDPSIFINAMADAGESYDNRGFIAHLSESGSPVLLDQMNSRTRDAGGLGEILHVIKTTVLIEVLVSGIVVLLVAGAWKRKRM